MIITLKNTVTAKEVEKYLLKNLNKFPKHSIFMMLAGHHHEKKDGIVTVAKPDNFLVGAFSSTFDRVINECEKACSKNCEKCKKCQEFHPHSDECVDFCKPCTWQEKEYEMGEVIPLYTIKIEENKFGLTKSAKIAIKRKFENLLKSDKPHVMIFASCFSHYSEINHVLRSSGLVSCLLVAKERGDITLGQAYHLDKEQQDFLKVVASKTCPSKCKYSVCNMDEINFKDLLWLHSWFPPLFNGGTMCTF